MVKLLRYPEDETTIRRICSMIDYTEALNPHNTSADVIAACEIAKRYGFATNCVYPTWAKLAAEHLKGSGIKLLIPVGYPHGSTTLEAKVAETRQALMDGAGEIDMVMNIARFMDGDYAYVKKEIEAVVEVCRGQNVGVKVILEVGYLSTAQIRTLVDIAVEAGAEYVKSSTGFGPGRATMNNVAVMVDAARGRIKVKATGSVASLEDQLAFIELGASRVAGRGHIVDQLRSIGMDL